MIGRTKNGGTLNYSSTWTTAESDDGKSKRKKIVSESATISYGVITWNAKTIAKLVATARVSEVSGKRKAKIGGVENDNGTRYLIRGVHKDKVAGNQRFSLRTRPLLRHSSSLNRFSMMRVRSAFTRRKWSQKLRVIPRLIRRVHNDEKAYSFT